MITILNIYIYNIMLNLLKLKKIKNNNDNYYLKTKSNLVNNNRHYPPAIQEWSNSIYQYNKNNTKKILTLDKYLLKLIKAVYSLKDKYYKKKLKFKKFRKWQKYTYNNNKILLSDPVIKHRNDNLIINLYLYNRDKLFYLALLKKIVVKNYLKNLRYLNNNSFYQKSKNIFTYKKSKNIFVSKKLLKKRIDYKILNRYLFKKINFLKNLYSNSSNYLLTLKKYLEFKINLKKILWKKYSFNKQITKENYFLFNKKFLNYCKKFEIIIFNKEILIITLKKCLLLDKFKLTDILLLPLTRLLKKIYNKKIIFNLINLKRPYFNSSLLSRLLVSKINNRKLNLSKAYRGILLKIRPIYNERLDYFKHKLNFEYIQKIKLDKKNIIYKYDILNKYLANNFFIFEDNSDKYNQMNIIKNLKNKNICGIRLKFRGRLTRRIIAQRALRKIAYKGLIRNSDASYRGLPTMLVRGQFRSNLDYYKIHSKTRIGAYGVKSWINLK